MPLRRPESLVQLIVHEVSGRIAARDWRDTLPGMLRMAAELGVSRETVEKALQILTRDGMLEPPVHGQPRKIAKIPDLATPPVSPKKVGWVSWRPLVLMDRSTRETISEVVRLAGAEDAEVFVAPLSGSQVRHVPRDLEHLLSNHAADAWIVQGATLEMTKWFAGCGIPCLAVGGRVGTTAVAQVGFNMREQIEHAVDYLIGLGHRRIILPLPPQTPKEGPRSSFENAFRSRMDAAGARVSPEYNLPHLDGKYDSWHQLLESLFAVTPPSAFILYNGMEAAGLSGFLHRRGLRIPEDVSLIVEADEPILDWIFPDPSRIEFSSIKLAKTIWKWLREAIRGNVSTGRQLISGTFIPGKTTGPPRA